MSNTDPSAFRPPSRIGFSPKPPDRDTQSTSPNMGFTKHPEFYFPDGSLAIRISDTVFRVHASILARHSEVFRDMAEIPQPPSDQCETVEGVPVVDLQDDAKEFEETLSAIYDPFYFDTLDSKSKLNEILSFVSGPLRITTKYAMPKLRAKCISLLEAKFPSTLDGCLSLLKSQFQYTPADIVRLITLASPSHANVPSVLPWAYYLCTHMDVDDVLKNGVLTWESKALVLGGKEKLWEALKKHSHRMLFQFIPSPSCTSSCALKVSTQQNSSSSPFGAAMYGVNFGPAAMGGGGAGGGGGERLKLVSA
ncbi:hypothetical protein NMY22_g12168 [Coprinellus aureogranulatus]|nr:hypothetical protein NMY22_g12168 [Coprinellus aureogranulatus]